MEPADLSVYENIRFCVMENLALFNMNMAGKSYMKIVMDFVEECRWKIKYLRI